MPPTPFVRHARRRTPSAAAMLVPALTLAALAPTVVRAQSSAAFELCVLGSIQACTTLDVFTTALGDGTAVDVIARQAVVGTPTVGLFAFGFYFAPLAGTDAADRPVTVTALGGAPAAPQPSAWVAQGGPGALLLQDTSDPFAGDPAPVQFVASCGDGTFPGGDQVTSLVTCGTGAYRFRTETAAVFTAAGITGVEIDLFGGQRDPNAAYTVVTCDVGAGRANLCVDYADATRDPVPFTFRPLATTVPEPSAAALLAGALAALGALAVGRRRARAATL